MAVYAVTGGAGFIGSHLVDALLAQGHGVRVLDDLSTGKRENIDARAELAVGDVADVAIVRRVMDRVDGCFHLAAIASVQRGNEEWVNTHRVNVTGTVTVLDAARAAGRAPVVLASSAAVYGELGESAADEGTEANPITAYGADKFGSECHARVAYRVHGVPTASLRFFNVYGPRQDPSSPYSGVISIFAHRIARGQAITINGRGDQTRDFVFVSDVVTHLLASMRLIERTPSANVLNVCTGRGTTVRALADILGEVSGRTPRVEYGPARQGDIRLSLGDPSRAIARLGVAARTELRAGLAATLGHRAPASNVAATDA